MPVYTETKSYRTKAHMGMIDVTDDFRAAVQNACRNTGMKSGTITGFTTGGVAGLTTLEFEPGMVYHDLKAAMDVFSPYRDENGRGSITIIMIPGTMITARRILRRPSSARSSSSLSSTARLRSARGRI